MKKLHCDRCDKEIYHTGNLHGTYNVISEIGDFEHPVYLCVRAVVYNHGTEADLCMDCMIELTKPEVESG